MGLAVTCRQYNLALLPAAACFAIYQWRKHGFGKEFRWLVSAILSLILAAAPILFMVFAWKGVSSPGMANGMSYENWKAGVGLNLFRPLVTSFYTCVYLIPPTFPAMQRLKPPQRLPAFLAALIGGLSAALFGASLLQPGPLLSLIHSASRVPGGDFVAFGLIVSVTIFNSIALGSLLWKERFTILSNPHAILSVLVVAFFIAEQLGVGGNLPLYDRYILQFAPFLGVIAFAVLPKLTYSRVACLVVLSIVSHFILWRNAF